VDIVIDTPRVEEARRIVEDMLRSIGAERRRGRVYESEAFGPIDLDIVGFTYVGKVKRLLVDGGHVYVESPEDNIASNLSACIHLNSDLDCEKAAAVMAAQFEVINWDYLENKCRDQGTLQKLVELREKIRENTESRNFPNYGGNSWA
jgi:hypothetical protein